MFIKTRRATFSQLEVRAAGDDVIVSGYASTFNQPYDMGWYTETVQPGAFTKTLSEKPDVRFLINHADLPLARTISGTLDLTQDGAGLRPVARLNPNDPDVQRILPKMERGDLDQMSFGFGVIQEAWSEDYSERILQEISLRNGDVSIVTYPANPNTSITLDDARALHALPAVELEAVRSAIAESGPAGLMRELRTGKVISKANADTLREVLDHIGAASDSHDRATELLGGLIAQADPDDDDTQSSADAGGDEANGSRQRLELEIRRRGLGK